MNEETKSDSDPEREEWTTFVEDLINESDRAAVILGAAKIDTQLYQILQKVLVPCASGGDELLDGDRPLSSFHSRINMIYRLGLIDRQFAWALHLIRKIRNAFAHELAGVNLLTGPHRDRIRELTAPFRAVDNWEEFKKAIQKRGNFEEASADFRTVVAHVSVRLHRLFVMCQTLSTEDALPLIRPHGTNSVEKTGADDKEPA